MTLTVRQLTEIPYLRTRFHAGESGAENVIRWAHSIEYRNPWEWLEEGDLMMTVGLGIPEGAEAQVSFIEALAQAKVSGIAIGERMQAPPLTEAMVRAADVHALPILWTAYEVPFIQLSRAVAGAASHSLQQRRLVDAARIYDRVRAALVHSTGPAESLQELADELDCELWVCANDSGRNIFPGTTRPASAISRGFVDAVRQRGGSLPGILHITVASQSIVVVPVPARRQISLLAAARAGGDPPAYALLQHVATAVALAVERQWAGIEEERRLGGETLAALFDGRIGPVSAARQLARHGLAEGSQVLLATNRASESQDGLHHILADRGIPNVMLRRNDVLYCLVPAQTEYVNAVAEVLDADGTLGVSDPFEEIDHVPAAVREARWALDEARRTGIPVVNYGERQPSLLGARSVAEAHVLVDRVLGPLLAYDEEHGTELVTSLAAFLDCNRSWQRASSRLFVHKQTLVYRMARVEELTGRKLNETSSVAEFWLAIQARQLLAG